MSKGDVYQNLDNLGGFVTFDGVNVFLKYDADLIDVSLDAGSVSTTAQRSTGKSSFRLYDFDFKAGKMKLRFYVHGFTNDDALKNSNMLVRAAKDPVIKLVDDEPGFEYATLLSSYSIEYTKVPWFYLVEIETNAIRRMKLKTVNASGTSIKFDNPGSVNSGARVSITSSTSIENVPVSLNSGDSDVGNSIVVASMTSGLSFTIDGIDGKVTDQNGVNRILQTDLTRFPKVRPGENTFTSTQSLSWTVQYYPTFEV